MSSPVHVDSAAEWWRSSDDELLAALVEAESRFRREYAALVEMTAEAESRGLASRVGYPNLPELLRATLKITRSEARQRISHGGVAGLGQLSPDHLTVIRKVQRALPAHVSVQDQRKAEEILVAAARDMDAGTLHKVGREIVARLDQDGAPPDDGEQLQPKRELHIRTRANGSVVFKGELDSEAGALLKAVISPLAKPRDAQDSRSTAERQGDAFAEMVQLASGSAPSEGGERPHVAVTVPLELLKGQLGRVGFLSASAARRIACDAKILPVVLGSNSEPLDVGRASYVVPPAMRRALVVRDKGCAFPDCGRPAPQCHAHHIDSWADGGITALINLLLLCGEHHRLLHHSAWTVTIANGQPEFRPPGYIDPQRQPRRSLTW